MRRLPWLPMLLTALLCGCAAATGSGAVSGPYVGGGAGGGPGH